MSAVEVYPVRVDASLDAPLSRWLWIVKWVLVIPHYIVLSFLWIGRMRARRSGRGSRHSAGPAL